MRHATVGKEQVMIARALQDACLGTELAVRVPDAISGGSVVGDDVEAYVVIVPGGYQVEMWTHTGDDAYRIVAFPRLPDAIRCAIDAAAGRRPAVA